VVKTYFNQFAEGAHWGVIWDPSTLSSVPLILDKSDRWIKFTDANNTRRPTLARQYRKTDISERGELRNQLLKRYNDDPLRL
jgi:hypothetical protein